MKLTILKTVFSLAVLALNSSNAQTLEACHVPLRCEPQAQKSFAAAIPIANWSLPVNAKIPVTSCYGPRVLMKRFTNFHEGVDFGAHMRTPVSSVAPGKVIWAGSMGCAGRSVVIEHKLSDDRVALSIYKHLNSYKVVRGQKVKRGQLIALSGASGRKLSRKQTPGHRGCVAGPHLHLEFMLAKADYDARAVEKYINKTHGHLSESADPADPALFLPQVKNSCSVIRGDNLAFEDDPTIMSL